MVCKVDPPNNWDMSTHGSLSKLTKWAVDSRYPGNDTTPTDDDAIKAESKASSIYDSVVMEFKRRGMLI